MDRTITLIRHGKIDKPLSIAVNELNEGAIRILTEETNN